MSKKIFEEDKERNKQNNLAKPLPGQRAPRTRGKGIERPLFYGLQVTCYKLHVLLR